MSQRLRLSQHAAELTRVGLTGGDMQAKLAELIQRHDLTAEEVRRVAEMANRDTQLALYKVAEDKRFKFTLADPEVAAKQATKHAEESATRPATVAAKVAAANAMATGNPFGDAFAAPADAFAHSVIGPDTRASKLSLFHQPVDEQLLFETQSAKTRELLLSLDKTRTEYQALVKEAEAQAVMSASDAANAERMAVQSAVDLLMSGISLPSLALAVMGAVEGSGAADTDRKRSWDLLLSIVRAAKARGVPNHRMGFKFQGDLNAIDRLSAEDLVALAARSCGCPHSRLTLETQKEAARYLESQPVYPRTTDQHPFEDAAEWLQNRGAFADFRVPQQYLDEANTSNTPNGGAPIVVNGDSEFVISIRDLIGAQDRMLRLHAAQEYLGLQVKRIADAMSDLSKAEKTAQVEHAERGRSIGQAIAVAEKVAALPAIGGLAALAGSVLGSIAPKPKPKPAEGMTRMAALEAALSVARIGEIVKESNLLNAASTAMNVINTAAMAKSLLPAPPPRRQAPGSQEQAVQGQGVTV